MVEDEGTKGDLMDKINQKLELSVDEDQNREFLQHEYNRDGDSYRSPWTNKYWPQMHSEFFPSPQLRGLEEKAN